MRRYLIEAGVDADSVEVAPGATTRAAIASVRFAGFSSMVAVTSPYHLHRVMAEARRAGVVCVGCAPPTTPESADPAIRWVRIATEVIDLVNKGREPISLVAAQMSNATEGAGRCG